MLCSGYVARAHTKQLTELARQKSFSVVAQNKYKGKFLTALKGTSRNAAAFLKPFYVQQGQIFYCLLQAGTNPKGFTSSVKSYEHTMHVIFSPEMTNSVISTL